MRKFISIILVLQANACISIAAFFDYDVVLKWWESALKEQRPTKR